jgi:signal transduction histidine kinase
MLALFLLIHVNIIITLTGIFFGNSTTSPTAQLRASEGMALSIFLATILLWTLLTTLAWCLLYFILKPVSDTISEKENFVANAHHELKTPLTILKSEVDLFDTQNFSKTQKKDLLGLKFQIERMILLINHLLSNLNKDRELLILSDMNVKNVIEQSLQAVQQIYSDCNLCTILEVDENLIIKTNDILFKQLVLSIIENAFKHCNAKKDISKLVIKSNGNNICFYNSAIIDTVRDGNGMRAIYSTADQLKMPYKVYINKENDDLYFNVEISLNFK